MYNKYDSLTSWHKLILDGLAYCLNQSIKVIKSFEY